MADAELPGDPVQFILHVTDFSSASHPAFAHALRLAVANKADLTVLHVGGEEVDWDSFPSIRQMLQQWGFLEPGAERADVAKLGITVRKIAVPGRNVADVLVDFCHQRSVDLLVLATGQHGWLDEWLHPGSPEHAVRKIGVPALFVPAKGRGCVALDDGRVTLHHVLVPVDHEPSPDEAIVRGLRALRVAGAGQPKLTLLHVGTEEEFPQVVVPSGPWQVEKTVRFGVPSTAILAAAEEVEADLLVMVTEGTEGFLDVLRGSTTEQVLRRAPCPVLAVPAEF